MRESVLQRWFRALAFALLGGAVAYWNPVARLEAHLDKDVVHIERVADIAASDLADAGRSG
ncbi:hypothetical protein [Sphingomonas sp. S2-65]|uniref:hypothetical protein n=1 Tax=Sphingomonas sp. S2-65 TaxID=2903960 RepID=UPI001F252DB0|nr:hypothetical protein [Sphingomonas sp. S2-65]UYY58975.1 hypothetical protein LZ586_02395 [Sphingomonas sp. S2-65]